MPNKPKTGLNNEQQGEKWANCDSLITQRVGLNQHKFRGMVGFTWLLSVSVVRFMAM